jgi:hypothetical protein
MIRLEVKENRLHLNILIFFAFYQGMLCFILKYNLSSLWNINMNNELNRKTVNKTFKDECGHVSVHTVPILHCKIRIILYNVYCSSLFVKTCYWKKHIERYRYVETMCCFVFHLESVSLVLSLKCCWVLVFVKLFSKPQTLYGQILSYWSENNKMTHSRKHHFLFNFLHRYIY